MSPIHTLFTSFLLVLTYTVFGQTSDEKKMDQLDFMIGEWIGTSSIYEDGVVTKQGSAYQKIKYGLNKSIVVIELRSSFLQLHTIIRYDKKDDTYYYYPFSEGGTNRYPAEYRDGKLTVWSNETNRFTFSNPSLENFQEIGERLVNGQWVKYFEDNFQLLP